MFTPEFWNRMDYWDRMAVLCCEEAERLKLDQYSRFKKILDRKVLLLCCAVCRSTPKLREDLAKMPGGSEHVMECCEKWADGHLEQSVLTKIYAELQVHIREWDVRDLLRHYIRDATGPERAVVEMNVVISHMGMTSTEGVPAEPLLAHLAHDVLDDWALGHEFNFRVPAEMIPLALEIYRDRKEDFALDNSLLRILADGLDDTGTCPGEVLQHLRLPNGALHVRGCWALDCVLAGGKSGQLVRGPRLSPPVPSYPV